MPEIPQTQARFEGTSVQPATVAAGADLTLARFGRSGTVLICTAEALGAGTITITRSHGRGERSFDVPVGTTAVYLSEGSDYERSAVDGYQLTATFTGTVAAVALGDHNTA